MGVRRRLHLWAAGVALALPLALTWTGQIHDVGLYARWSAQMAAGLVPYRDFPCEYPPLALLAIAVPGLGDAELGPWGYAARFMVAMGVVAAWQKGALARASGRPLLTLWAAALLEAPLQTTYLKRFDVLAAATTTMGLCALARAPKRWTGWMWLGLGGALKLYPLLLLPVAMGYAWQHQRRAAPVLGGTAIALAAFVLPLAAAYASAGPSALDFFSYHHARGLHVPTTYTSVWMLAHYGEPLVTDFGWGAMQVAAPWGAAWAQLARPVMGAALAVTYAAVCLRLRRPSDLWRGALAVVTCGLLASKVLSPQFLVWLVPLATMASLGDGPTVPMPQTHAAAPGRLGAVRRVLAGVDPWPWVLTLAAAVLTAQLFPGEVRLAEPGHYRRALLIARSAVLCALWGHVALKGLGVDRRRPAGDARRVPQPA